MCRRTLEELVLCDRSVDGERCESTTTDRATFKKQIALYHRMGVDSLRLRRAMMHQAGARR